MCSNKNNEIKTFALRLYLFFFLIILNM